MCPFCVRASHAPLLYSSTCEHTQSVKFTEVCDLAHTSRFEWNYYAPFLKLSMASHSAVKLCYDRSAKKTNQNQQAESSTKGKGRKLPKLSRSNLTTWHGSVENISFYCFASASLLLISLLFFVTTTPGLGSAAAAKDGFFLADWNVASCFSFDFFTIFPVAVVGVFLGLLWDTGLSAWRRRS